MNSNLFINSQTLKPFAFLLLFSLFSLHSYSQTGEANPCGDVANGQLTVGAANTCNLIPITSSGATPWWNAPGSTCGETGASEDIWFWFDANTALTTIYVHSDRRDIILTLFDAGPSGSPTACDANAVPVACANDLGTGTGGGAHDADETIVFVTDPTHRYRVRVERNGSNGTLTGDICVYDTIIVPANDLCANATPLVCGSNFPAETTVGASDIPSGAATGCVLGSVGVWYTFTGDGQAWTISSTPTGGFDIEMAIFEGTCAGFTTSIACSDDVFADLTETVTFNTTNLAIYYVYIAYNNVGTVTGDFSITATCAPPATAPPNDDPCGGDIAPYILTVNPDYSCGTVTAGTVDLGTDSGLDACSGSNGGITNNDVWFSFVATGTAHKIELLNVSGGTDMVMSVYDGISGCGGITIGDVIACYDDPDPISQIQGGFIMGQTYFIQVFTYFGGASNATFDVCIGTPPPPPANDDPCGAVNAPYVLTVNADLACGNVSSGTVLSALETGPNGCIGDADDDVWFSFQATSTSHVVQLSNISGSTINLNHGIYGPFALAATCSVPAVAASLINCSDFNTSITGSLIPGQYYFVQVYTNTNSGGQDTSFDICIGTPPIVANDDPCNAIDLTPSINPDFLCAAVTPGTVEWATDSSVFGCIGSSDDDVWYSFVANSVDNTHSVDLLNISGSTLNMAIAVYDGGAGCGTLGAAIVCSFTATTSFPTVFGNTYYVQIYTTNADANPTSTFDICIGTPPPPPFNDDPCGATPLTVDQFCSVSTGSVASATDSGIDSCFGTPNDDVWFTFVATDAQQTVSLVNVFGSDTDMYHAVYGGFNPPNCGAVAVGNNISCSDGNTTNLSGLTIGDTYYVQVFTFSGAAGATTAFDICVTEPCSAAIPINPIPTVCPLIGAPTGSNPFTTLPFNPDPTGYIDCTSANVTLEAYTQINLTTDYIVEKIDNTLAAVDYSPAGFSTPQVIPNDDVWADAFTSMPFNFCFYGTTYDEFIVGSNGAISFDPSINPGSASGWSFSASIPSTQGAITNESIFAVFQDLNPAANGGTGVIESWVEGASPCRTVHISYVNIPLFSDNTRLFTGKTVLYETTNIIEIYVLSKEIENGNVGPWNGGNAILGIQGNAASGEALAAPCRNGLDDNWEAFSEAWRFVPSGPAIAPNSYNWYSTLNPGSLGTLNTLDVTVPDTYFVETEFTICGATVTLTDEIVVTQSSVTWTGVIDDNWYRPGNWDTGNIPTPADCVLIPVVLSGNYPSANLINLPIPIPPSTIAYALNLTIDTGATLDIAAGTVLSVTDYIIHNGIINVESTGSIVQINDGAVNVNNNSGSGSINMEREVLGVNTYDYIYWSSPVESFSVGNISPGSTRIYEWQPTVGGNLNGYGDWLSSSEIMQNGKGYIVRNIIGTPTPLTPVFSGKPNNGIITRAITRGTYAGVNYPTPGGTIATNQDDNWNLVGNPYPSAISADDFLTRNATNFGEPRVITGTVYLWRHLSAPSTIGSNPFYGDFVYNYDPNDYISHNGTGSTPPGLFGGDIAAGQAFFVLMRDSANAATSTVVFNNGMRGETLVNSEFFRTEDSDESTTEGVKHRIWLDLVSQDNAATSILVGYVEDATDELDNLYDAHELSEASARFYSLVENTALTIQGKALPFNDTDTVPLGIEISQDGNYSIAINTLDGLFLETDQAIYLEDTYNGIIHDLRVNPFSFNAEVGIYDDRFVLRYNNESLGIDDFNNSGLEIVAPNNAYIKVTSSNSSISSVTIYDLLGRVLIDKKAINNSEFTLQTSNYAEGAYIVKAVLIDGKQKLQKVIIRNMR